MVDAVVDRAVADVIAGIVDQAADGAWEEYAARSVCGRMLGTERPQVRGPLPTVPGGERSLNERSRAA